MAAVVRDGEVLWSGATGHADLEAGIPLTPETRMRIGSVSKPFTAAIALRLAEQGLLDLDAPIGPAVPEFAAPGAGAITPAMLASHTSGVRHYDFSNYLEANNIYVYSALSDALAIFADDPLLAPPGDAFEYSSLGYNLLGVLAERAADESYADLLAREVTSPLGLSGTTIDDPLEIIPNRTRFYTRFPDDQIRNTIWRDSSDFYPSGGVLSTAEDLARFTSAMFGGEWLSAESLARMTTEATTNAGEPVGYTFGWQVTRNEASEAVRYEHGGETNGAYAFVGYDPQTRLAVAGVVNANFAAGEPYFFEAISDRLPLLFALDAGK